MEGKITGTGKRIMTMMLSVIMVTGIFAGMKLEVRAAKNYSIDLSDPGSFMFALQNTYYSDDTLVFNGFSQPPAGDKYIYIVRWDYIYNSKRVGSSIMFLLRFPMIANMIMQNWLTIPLRQYPRGRFKLLNLFFIFIIPLLLRNPQLLLLRSPQLLIQQNHLPHHPTNAASSG